MPSRFRLKNTELIIQNTTIPVFVHIEKRRGFRASFVKGGLNIRISKFENKRNQEKIIANCLLWAKSAIAKKPELLQRYTARTYNNGDVFKTFNNTFVVQRKEHELRSVIAEISTEKELVITTNPVIHQLAEIKPVVSKVLAKLYRPYMLERVNHFQQFIPKEHNNVRLKYNTSNWGSCSRKGNVNFSTRLLLSNADCIDYVIVHELCHLMYLNHGAKFWQNVERIIPNYRQIEQTLKALSHRCYL